VEVADKTTNPEEERAMQYALRVLGYRPRSEAEMKQRLEQKGFSASTTDYILARLTQLGLLDDRDFARGWVMSRRGYGPARLKQELRQKGIHRDLAEEMIVTNLSADEEYSSAWQVASRTLRTNFKPVTREVIMRLRRLLLRRGFSYEVICRVCARLQDPCTAEEDWLE
jgi:regulatory protein